MSEHGIVEFDRARRKAAQRIGVEDKRCWPDYAEIQDALLNRYRLFRPDAQRAVTRTLWSQALAAMETFSEFKPRLVGHSAAGTGSLEQGVRLHLFSEDPREVVFRLLDQRIPWQEADCHQRYADGARRTHPMFRVVSGEVPVELVVMPMQALHSPPLAAVSDKPERGIGRRELEQLIDEQDAPDPGPSKMDAGGRA